MTHTLSGLAASLVLATVGLAASAQAQTVVFGSSHARTCYEAALTGERGSRSALSSCETALEIEPLGARDWAATQVNYGILLYRAGRMDEAMRAYDRAIDRMPRLPEVWLNRGIVWLAMSDFVAAEADFTRSLELDVQDRHKAYYNRALSFDAREMYREAYEDYQRALEDRPGWELPLQELERYEVVRGSR